MDQSAIDRFLADSDALEAFASAEWLLGEEAKKLHFYDDAKGLKETAAQAALLASKARGAHGWDFYGGNL